MQQEHLMQQIHDRLWDDQTVEALFLAGSMGKGEADRFSDIDLVAVVAPENQREFNGLWQKRLQTIVPIVFFHEQVKGEHLANAITEQWQRIDLITTTREALQKRAKNSLRPLFDRNDLYGTLPESIEWPGPNKGYLSYLSEFLRVFGLLPVAIGRGEYLVGVTGVDLLRTMLFNLLSEEVERVDKGGMLAWSRRLSAEQLALLATIPPVAPTRQSVISAHLACAAAFLPRACQLAEKWNIEWPQRLEEAAWKHLERELAITKDHLPALR